MASFAVKSRVLIEALAASDLIAAFQGGEDRESVLKKARKIWSEPSPDGWDGLPSWLLNRLLQDPDGADVVIPARVGDDLKVRQSAVFFADVDDTLSLYSTSHALHVFDEQIAVLCSNNNTDSPELDVIYCSRSSAFENCLPEMHENEPRRDYYRRLHTWRQLDQPDIPVVTPETRVSCMGSGLGTLFGGGRQAKYMCQIQAVCQECGTHGLVACVGEFIIEDGRFRNLAARCFDDDAARRAAAQAAFQELLLDLYTGLEWHLDDLPPVGALRRERNRAVRGLLARLRALVDKGRAACLRDGFLYEAAPAGVFRLVVSFL